MIIQSFKSGVGVLDAGHGLIILVFFLFVFGFSPDYMNLFHFGITGIIIGIGIGIGIS